MSRLKFPLTRRDKYSIFGEELDRELDELEDQEFYIKGAVCYHVTWIIWMYFLGDIKGICVQQVALFEYLLPLVSANRNLNLNPLLPRLHYVLVQIK